MTPLPPLPFVLLVVEDQALIRMTLVEALEDSGFEVLEAADATEALEFLSARPDISALISDVTIPGAISGYNLAQMARLSHPRLLVIMASGRPPRFAELPEGGRFFAKPYNLTTLMSGLQEMMAAAYVDAIKAATVTMTVMKLGGLWCLKIIDRLGTRFIGASETRGPIEALATRMMEDALAAGEQPHLSHRPA